jgi:type IV pilus assembly protein PilQ
MRGKTTFRVLPFLGVLALVLGVAAESDRAPININQISVEPGVLYTKVVLESASPLSIQSSQYLGGTSPKLVIDVDKVSAQRIPELATDKTSLVKDIIVDNASENSSRLIFDLKERVPYRIYSDPRGTVIEFNRYQNGQKEYVLDPGLEAKLASAGMPSSYLKDISVSPSEGRVDVVAELTDETPSHVFVLNDPLRLVVDLHNTLFTRKSTSYSVGRLGVREVRAAQFQLGDPYTITRMVFDLDEPQLYSVSSREDRLIVSFYESPPAAPRDFAPGEPTTVTMPEPDVSGVPPATQEPPPDTDPVSTILLAEPPPDTDPEPTIPEERNRVNDKVSENNVALPAVDSGGAQDPEETGQSSQFQPRTLVQNQQKYQGEVLSLKFKDADLRDVIFYLAEFAGLNVTFDPGVTGIVSVNLVDVPWDQALDLILKQNKMGKVIEGNVLRIAPMSVLTREREELLALEESEELSGPLVTRTFWLSYSRAPDVQALLNSKLSNRGEIIIDNRTNTLTITDVEDRMSIIESMIEVFDTPTPQVSIEARIVEATSTFIRNLGIQWGFQSIQDPFFGNQTSLKFPNRVLVDGALIPQGIVTKGIAGPLGGYAINLPAPAFTTAAGISFANVLDTFRLDMALTALETSGSGKIISAPKITTQNNQEAAIIQGRQIPVQTVANFTVTTRYVNAALELTATPQITAEGTIIMYIQIQNNAADFANLVNGIPPITTQSATTTVMVPDGGTTVIGGIYRTEDSITRERVPLLHKIPLLGNLFKSFARTKQNRELLIFITPRIIK